MSLAVWVSEERELRKMDRSVRFAGELMREGNEIYIDY